MIIGITVRGQPAGSATAEATHKQTRVMKLIFMQAFFFFSNTG